MKMTEKTRTAWRSKRQTRAQLPSYKLRRPKNRGITSPDFRLATALHWQV